MYSAFLCVNTVSLQEEALNKNYVYKDIMTENGAPKKYKLVFLGEQSGMLSQISYFYQIFIICCGWWDYYVCIGFWYDVDVVKIRNIWLELGTPL